MKQRISIFYANGESNNPIRHLMAAALILCLIFTIAFPTATFAADNTGGSDGDRGDGAGNESTYSITISYVQGSGSFSDIQEISSGDAITLTWEDPMVNTNGETLAFIGWFRDAECNEPLNIDGTDQLYTPEGNETLYCVWRAVDDIPNIPPEQEAQLPESLEDTVVVQDLHSEPQSRRAVEERIHLYEGGAFTFNDGYTLGVYRSDDPSIQLTQGNDYDVTYANNTGSGTMTVTITGKGAYTGEITKQVQIAPITSIQINDAAFSNTKNPPLTGTVKAVVNGTEKTLQAGTDYIIDYGDGSLTIGDHTTILFGIGEYTGMATGGTYRMVGNITDTTVTFPAQTYTGKTLKPTPVIKLNNAYSWMEPLREGTDYTITYINNKNAGTASATITGKGYYKGVRRVNFTISKAKNPMTLKGKTASVKYSKVKKKAQTIKLSKAVTISNAKGTLTYKKTSGNAKITVNKKTGKITVKKGLKKGTYTVKIKVTAAASNNYKAGSKTVKCKIKVK